MEEKRDLREFQAQLAERLKDTSQPVAASAKLGFLAGGRHWLVDLDQVNEVVTTARLTSVPWAKPWFLGVASVRGVIHGCTDLAAFLGLMPPSESEETRLLLAHPRFGINAALVIERAVGLRSVKTLSHKGRGAGAPAWILGEWQDADGVVWTELSLEQLVNSADFQQAGMETL